ncbi:MAG: peptidylprolyl isomerase [Planctomycetota bacterium]|nr:MAG: peptidylprolyl isomerase [Planctomycetota bacterium]
MSIKAILETSKGQINLELFDEQTPIACANFVNLISRKYYDGLLFHRVIPNFMVQTGCPSGTGAGSPGYEFVDQCLPDLLHDKPGRLSMAKPNRPDSNGSQFFITHVPTPHLDGIHTVFGKVCEESDQEIVNSIVQGDTIEKAIIIGDDFKSLLSQESELVDSWNKTLDKMFPDLPEFNYS